MKKISLLKDKNVNLIESSKCLGIIGLVLGFSLVCFTPTVLANNDQSLNSSQQTPQGNASCEDKTKLESCQAFKTLNTILNIAAGLVVPIITIVIVIAGFQYMTAGSNSDTINQARSRIFNAILALVCFFLIWSVLKWIIPGGWGA